MTTRILRIVAAPAVILFAIGVAAGCVGYDPRAYDGDAPSPPSARPSSTATSAPASPGSTSPASSGSLSHVDLAHAVGDDVTVDVADRSGTMLEATSGSPGDGASVEAGQLLIVNDDPSTLRLTWAGGPCATADVLLIDAARRDFALGQRGCGGDSIVNDRVLILRFSVPIQASDIKGRVQDAVDLGG